MGKFIVRVEDHLVLPAVVRLSTGPERFQRQSGGRVPEPVPVRLLIDTGAKRTTLIPGLISHLDPPSGADVHVMTPLATVVATLYWVRIDFPGTGLTAFEQVLVARLPMPSGLSRFHGLLGRDLLCQWEAFLYEGRRGRCTLRDTPGLLSWLRHRL